MGTVSLNLDIVYASHLHKKSHQSLNKEHVSNKLRQRKKKTGKVVECSKNTCLEYSTGKQDY